MQHKFNKRLMNTIQTSQRSFQQELPRGNNERRNRTLILPKPGGICASSSEFDSQNFRIH